MLALQAVVFAIGAFRGVQHTPYAWLFRDAGPAHGSARRASSRTRARRASRRRSGSASRWSGSLGFAIGVTPLALVATGLALVAALLNAVFGFCLGCEIYLLLQRATAATSRPDPAPSTRRTER